MTPFRSHLALALLLASCVGAGSAAEDPYSAWSHGRPQEAIPALHRLAAADDRWDAWLDLGLAAAAAGDTGRATAWLLEARARAPERPEPRAALRALGATVPPSWLERLGPLAWPGCGWPGVAALAILGMSIGLGLSARRRGPALLVAGIAFIAGAPGQVASWHDRDTDLIAVVRDTRLLDSAGNPGVAVAAGTVAVREPGSAWSGRVLVALPDGQRGFLPLSDTVADADGP